MSYLAPAVHVGVAAPGEHVGAEVAYILCTGGFQRGMAASVPAG